MLEILQFYVSSFEIWLGITFGGAILFGSVGQAIGWARNKGCEKCARMQKEQSK